MVSRPFTDLKYMYFCGNGSKFEFSENVPVWAHIVYVVSLLWAPNDFY